MLEDKDLQFASRYLEGGIGASAGIKTVRGSITVERTKYNVQEVVASLDIQNLTKRFPDSTDRIHDDNQIAITRLFSPLPTFSDVSYTAWSTGIADSATVASTYSSTKEDKIIVEQKLLCNNQQMEYHKYVISCQN